MKLTLVPLRYYIALAIAGFLSGCASPEYTTRKCVVQLHGQVAPGQVLTTLFCEKEEPYTPENPE